MSIMIRVIAMNENLFLWGIWLLWCLVTFFYGEVDPADLLWNWFASIKHMCSLYT